MKRRGLRSGIPLAVLLLAVSLATYSLLSAQRAPEPLRAGEERLGSIAGVNTIVAHCSTVCRLGYSVAKGNEKAATVIDGREGPTYDGSAPPIFSPDGRHWAYVGSKRVEERDPAAWQQPGEGYRDFVVLDGQPGPDMAQDRSEEMLFSPDGKRFAYVATRAMTDADSRALDGYMGSGLMYAAVIDGKRGPWYHTVRGLAFSPDGAHVAYVATRAKGETDWLSCVVSDGKEGPWYRGIGSGETDFEFSPDSRHLAYLANRGGDGPDAKGTVVVDGAETWSADLPCSPRGASPLTFSPDSRRVAYSVSTRDGEFAVVDGQKGLRWPSIEWPPVFSPDSRRVAYVGEWGWQWLVVEGQKVGRFRQARAVFFSPDSRHVVAVVRVDQGYAVMVDGKLGRPHELIGRCGYSPDGQKLIYVAQDGDQRCVVVNEQEGPKYGALGEPVYGPGQTNAEFRLEEGRAEAVYEQQQMADYPVLEGTPVVSADGARLAYSAKKGAKWLAVIDGREGVTYDWVGVPAFSPNGRHVAYQSCRGGGWKPATRSHIDGPWDSYDAKIGGKWRVVCDGQEGAAFDWLVPNTLVVRDDGMVEYLGLRGGFFYRVREVLKGSPAVAALPPYPPPPGTGTLPSEPEGPDLLRAVQWHDAVTMSKLLDEGADPGERDREGLTPLAWAAWTGYVEAAKLLLDHGAAANGSQNGAGDTPLTLAAEGGRLEIVKLLLARRAEGEGEHVRWGDLFNRNSPVDPKRAAVVALLLDHGLDPNTKSGDVCTLLEAAAAQGDRASARVLIQRGAKETLGVAAALGDVAKARALLAQGADPNAFAAAVPEGTGGCMLTWAAFGGSVDIARDLLAHGATGPAARDAEPDLTPLVVAARLGHLDLVRLFLERGVGCEAGPQILSAALHNAAREGRLEVVKLLLEHGADPNWDAAGWRSPGAAPPGETKAGEAAPARPPARRGRKAAQLGEPKAGEPPAPLAPGEAKAGETRPAEAPGPAVPPPLPGETPPPSGPAQGSRPVTWVPLPGETVPLAGPLDNQPESAFRAAVFAGHEDVAKLLLQHGAKHTLGTAIMLGDVDAVRRLMAQGIDVKTKNGSGTPLHTLAWTEHVEMAQFLLDQGLDVNAPDDSGATPLFTAARGDHVDMARFLLDRGANVNAVSWDWSTPLLEARYFGGLDMIRLLLDRGADPNVMDREGNTPLSGALGADRRDIALLLRERGARE